MSDLYIIDIFYNMDIIVHTERRRNNRAYDLQWPYGFIFCVFLSILLDSKCRPSRRRRRTANPDRDRTADRRFSRRPRVGGGPWRCTSATTVTFWRAKPSARASKENGPDACRPVLGAPSTSRPVSAPIFVFISIMMQSKWYRMHQYCIVIIIFYYWFVVARIILLLLLLLLLVCTYDNNVTTSESPRRIELIKKIRRIKIKQRGCNITMLLLCLEMYFVNAVNNLLYRFKTIWTVTVFYNINPLNGLYRSERCYQLGGARSLVLVQVRYLCAITINIIMYSLNTLVFGSVIVFW